MADIRASCWKCQRSCFARWEQNLTTAPVLRLGCKEMLTVSQWAHHTFIFAQQAQIPVWWNLFSTIWKQKQKCTPGSERVLYHFYSRISGSCGIFDCMTKVFKELPMRAPFTCIIKLPPRLRTIVPTSKWLQISTLCPVWATPSRCEALLHPVLVWKDQRLAYKDA